MSDVEFQDDTLITRAGVASAHTHIGGLSGLLIRMRIVKDPPEADIVLIGTIILSLAATGLISLAFVIPKSSKPAPPPHTDFAERAAPTLNHS